MKKYWTDSLTLGLLFILLMTVCVQAFWILQAPSDSMEYLGPALSGKSVGAFPWLDRVFLGDLLRLFCLLVPAPITLLGTSFAMTVSFATLALGTVWLYQRQGWASALTLIVTCMSSYYFYLFSGQVFAEPTLVLTTLISAICFLEYQRQPHSKWLYLSGVFAAAACLTKITGIAIPCAVTVLLLRNQQWKDWARFTGGFFGGVALWLLLFVLLYGWPQLLDVFHLFFSENLQANMAGQPGFNNAVSFWEPFFDKLFFPIFLTPLMFPAMYRHPRAKVFTTLGWSYFLVMYGIYWASGRGYTPIPNYIYPAFFCFQIAFSFVFGEWLVVSNSLSRWRLTGFLAVLFAVGFLWGTRFDPGTIYQPSFHPDLSGIDKRISNLILMLLIPALLLVQYQPRKLVVMTSLVLMVLWGSSFSAGTAYHLYNRIIRPDTEIYYQYAPLLSEVQSEAFDIYIPSWKAQVDAVRLRHIYRVFYAKNLTSGTEANDYAAGLAKARENIRLSEDIYSFKEGRRPVLTNQPELLQNLWGRLQTLQRIAYQGEEFVVVQKDSSKN